MRTRQAIIEAYLALLQRNPTMPTASRIAKEAGVSVRSIFGHFSDLNALTLATADHAIAKVQATPVARNVDGDRATRIQSHVAARAFACEQWLPLWRVLVSQDQPELRRPVALVRFMSIERMKLMYKPELSTLAEPECSRILIVLATQISFESWHQLRHFYGLSINDGQAAWRVAIDRVLPLCR